MIWWPFNYIFELQTIFKLTNQHPLPTLSISFHLKKQCCTRLHIPYFLSNIIPIHSFFSQTLEFIPMNKQSVKPIHEFTPDRWVASFFPPNPQLPPNKQSWPNTANSNPTSATLLRRRRNPFNLLSTSLSNFPPLHPNPYPRHRFPSPRPSSWIRPLRPSSLLQLWLLSFFWI